MKPLNVVELDGGRIAVMLALPEGAEPPTEILVFAKGITETTKGPILFDDDAGKAILAKFRDQGLDALPFDIGHGMLSPFAPPDGHKAAGWFKPKVREDGLYAADIEWTEYGATALRRREFRYFSPALIRDNDSGRAVELINIALTNIPATKRQKPLVADAIGEPQEMTMPENEKTAPVVTAPLVPKATGGVLQQLNVATEAQAVERVADLLKLSFQLLGLTGASTHAEAITVLSGWRATVERSVELQEQIREFESRHQQSQLEAAIQKYSREGKLPPCAHEAARMNFQTAEQLERFMAAMPRFPEGTVTERTESIVTLTAEEKQVCANIGISEETYLAEKRAQREQSQANRGGF